MVICKFFLQGTCRFGQYCRFEHNNYGNNQSDGGKNFGDGKSIVLGVAEEILSSERGGQWLLSCFGPFKEQSCIPGMDDVSPEEVRWEMYQAQKNGTVDQTKLQFQQLCQDMNAKRDALKNPSHETASMLEKLQKGNKDNGVFGGKNNFTLSTAQLGNNNSSTNIFGSKSFGTTSGPFSGGFSSPTTTSTTMFGRNNTNSSSIFGAKPSFGGNPIFGAQSTANSIFGSTTSSTTSVFGGTQQNMPTFGSAAQSSTSFLTPATNSQSVFGQSSTFGIATQQNNIFASTQPTTSVFSSGTAPSTSLFANSMTTQTNTSPFGNNTQGTTNLFGSGATTIQPSSSIFGHNKTAAAFGGGPIFGAAPAFGGTPTSASNYVTPSAFNNSSNVFGATTANPSFGSNGQTTNSFSALATPSQNIFTNSTNSNLTFGATPTTTTMAFANAPFGPSSSSSATVATPFSRAATFATNLPSNTTSAFGSTAPTTGFPNASNTAFASSIVTTTSTMSNPFAPRSQQSTMSFASTPSGTTFGGMSTGPFGNSVNTPIDNSIYSIDTDLNDDEKSIYMSDHFILGKIPLKPPTIELR